MVVGSSFSGVSIAWNAEITAAVVNAQGKMIYGYDLNKEMK